MTQADRVHSTPPTNTSAKQSRRSILGAIATGTVAAMASTPATAAAAPVPDPIYAAIERHRVCAAKHEAAWDVRGRFDDCQMNDEQERQLKALEDATDLAWEPCEAAGISSILLRRLPPVSSRQSDISKFNSASTASTCRAERWRPRTAQTAAIGWNAFWAHSSSPSTRSARRWRDG